MANADITSLVVQVKSDGVKNAATDLKNLAEASDKAEKRVESLAKAMKLINDANRLATTAADSYMVKLREQAALMQGMAAHSRTAAGGTEALAAAMALLAASLNNLNQDTQRADRSTRQHTEAMREAHAMARGLSGSLGMLWMTYGNIAGMAVGVAIGASLKGIVAIGKDVEHTLEGIRVKGMESTESIQMLRDVVMDVGTGVHGPQQVVKALEALILAGLNAQQAAVGVRDALNLATVGGTTIEKAAEALVTIGTSLGYTAEGYSRVADVIAKTAAISLASVDSVAQSFKQASAVGKLYGVSLVDMGVQFAALSNLMVKNTAAGTAVKNFYSVLASGSGEVTKGLSLIGLSIKDLKDVDGNFKPFVDVMKTLRGATEGATTGFNSLTPAAQKNVQAMLTNERSNRLFTESLSLVRKEGKETGTALEDMFKKVNESFAFATIGAVAMSMTVDSQFKSVKNSLDTTLTKAFQNIQPELSLVAARMKAAFNSPEFLSGIQTLATAAANLAVFLVENSTALFEVVRALLAFKAGMFVMGMMVSLAESVVAVTAAFKAARIASIAFQLSLGALGIALAAGAALWVWWATKKSEATNSETSKQALNYMDDFKTKLDEEATRLERQIDLMKRGKNARDAETQSMREQQLQMVKDQGSKVVKDAEDRLALLRKGFSTGQNTAVDRAKGGIAPVYSGDKAAYDQYLAAEKAIATARDTVNKKYAETEASQKRLVGLAAAHAELADKQAKASMKVQGGMGIIPETPKTKALNDDYNAELKRIQGEIDQVARTLSRNKEALQSYLKQGQIGEILMIKQIEAAEISSAQTTIDLLKVKLAAAKTLEDKGAVQQQIANAEVAQIDAVAAATSRSANQQAEYYSKLADANMKTRAKEFEASGQYVEAYKALNEAKYNYEKALLQSNLDNTQDAANKELIIARQVALEKERIAGIEYASVKQAYSAFEVLRGAASNIFKGLVADNQGLGISGIFTAAIEASQKFQDSLPALQQKLLALKALAEAEGASDFAKKDYNKALSEMQTLANNQKTMWAEVGESISKSLGDAFGHAGKSAGKLLMVTMQYTNTQKKLEADRNKANQEFDTKGLTRAQAMAGFNKIQADFEKQSMQASIHAYGDMAGAAQGFFDEGSKGYKALGVVSQVFHAAELAMTIAELVPKAIGAVLNQANGDPYTAFGRMAAMAAIVAGLGVALSGGGGGVSAKDRQAKAGTGTVLGDEKAKSESIAKSIEHLEKDSGLGLVHSQLMVNSLHNIEASMTGLSALVVRGKLNTASVQGSLGGAESQWLKATAGIIDPLKGITGKIIGAIFGGKVSVQDYGIKIGESTLGQVNQDGASVVGYTDTKKSGGLLRRDSYGTTPSAVDSAVTQQVSLIIKSLGDSVKLAGDALGISGEDFNKNLEAFKISIDKISFKDMKSEDIQTQFAAIFSALGDDMAAWAVKGLDAFTQLGEGPLETLMRITNNFIQVGDVLSVMGQKFKVFGLDAVKVSEQFITAAGGLDKLTSGTQFVVENFFTQAERMAPIAASVANALKDIAEMAAPPTTGGFSWQSVKDAASSEIGQKLKESILNTKTIEQFNALVHAQDLSTVSGQKMYVALMELAPAFKEVADYTVDLAEGTVELTRAQEKAKSILEKQTELEIALLRVQGHEQKALNKERQIELESLRKLSPMLAVAQNMIYAQETLNEIRAKELELYNLTHTAAEQLDNKRRLELQTTATYLTTLQEQIYAQQDLNAVKAKELELYNLSHTPAEQLANKRKLELTAMSESVRAVQEQINAREDFNAAHTQQISLEETLSGLLGLTNLARIKEMSTINKANVGIQERINAFKDADAGVTQAMALVSRSIDAEKKRIQEASTAQIDALRASIDSTKVASDSAKKSVDTIKSIFDEIASAVATLRGNVDSQVSLMQARSFIDMALVLARAGTLPDADKLKDAIGAVTKDQSEMYSSTSDFVYAQMVQAGKLEELGGLIGKQKTIAEQQLESLDTNNALIEDQIKVIEKATASQIKELDKQLQQAQDSVSVMRGVDLSVKSVESAIRDLQGSLSALASARSAAESVLPAEAFTSTATTSATSATSAIGGDDAIARTAAPSVSDSEMMMRSWFANNVDAPKNPTDGNIAAWIDLIQYTGFINTKTKFAKDFAEMQGHTPMSIASFEVGINRVPEDMFARIHKDEAVIPKRFNPFIPGNTQSSKDDSTNAEMLAELKALREEVVSLRATVTVGNGNTRQLASQFDSATNGGNTMLVSIVEDLTTA